MSMPFQRRHADPDMDRKRPASNTSADGVAKRPRWIQLAKHIFSAIWPSYASTSNDDVDRGVDCEVEQDRGTSTIVSSPPATPTISTARAQESTRTTREPEDTEATCAHTCDIYMQFNRTHHLDMSLRQFTGLCAYLCAILRLGYHVSSDDLDAFIYRYPEFAAQLRTLEREQIEEDTSRITSYHRWFLDREWEPSQRPNILAEREMREIWAENQYTFLQTEMSLKYLAQQLYYQCSCQCG